MNDESTIYFVSGGLKSRFFKSDSFGNNWEITDLPFAPSASSGAYSLCMIDKKNGVIVGGDYTFPDAKDNISVYTFDGGKTWYPSQNQPCGYRSCVIVAGKIMFCCGTNGIDYSTDKGKNWISFAKGNYFSLTTHKSKLIATTTNGSFHIFEFPE